MTPEQARQDYMQAAKDRKLEEPNSIENLKAILNDQPFLNSTLTVAEIKMILDNDGGLMPDEAVAWFRTRR